MKIDKLLLDLLCLAGIIFFIVLAYFIFKFAMYPNEFIGVLLCV